MVVFHILDAIAQDMKIEEETAEVCQIRPMDIDSDSDDEVVSRKKRGSGAAAGGAYSQLRFHIHLFGTAANGESLRCTVEGFQPFFFVQLPVGTAAARRDFELRLGAQITERAPNLKGCVQVDYCERKVLFGYTGDKRFPFAKLSVASLAAFRALKNLFLDKESRPCFYLYAGADPLTVCEANLDPMLRFFHLRNIKPCGWVATEDEPDEGVLNVHWEDIHPSAGPVASAPFLRAFWDIECYSETGEFPLAKKGYDRLAKQLFSVARDGEHAVELVLEAAVNPDAPPEGLDPLRRRGEVVVERAVLERALGPAVQEKLSRYLARKESVTGEERDKRVWDIRDALRAALEKSFPLAGDPVIQIGVVLERAGVPTERHIFVLGSCDEVPGATVHSFKTEKGMILAWAKAMQKWNPDVLIGYNIFGFDEKYLWQRAEELGVTSNAAMQSLTRLADFGMETKLEEKFLSSSAMGDNTMYIWSTHGRLQIDLFHYVKRGYNLPAYKLDYVCQHFMSGKLSGVDTTSEPGQWILKTKSTGDVVVGRYVTLLDETSDAVVEKLRITEVRAGSAVVVEAPTTDDAADLAAATADAVKWAIVKDDVSPQDIFKLQRGSSADRARIAAYCVQDCDLTLELFKKLDVFNNAMAMANACSVPVGYIFTRGQGIKIESLIFKECYNREQCIAVLPSPPRPQAPARGGWGKGKAEDEDVSDAPAQESYEGAIVLTPTPGFYFESPVGVADFASLYPSTIYSENISYDTLVWAKDYNMQGRFIGFAYGSEEAEEYRGPNVSWTDIEFDIWGNKDGDTRKHPEKERKGLRVCRYAQLPGDGKGTLPEIVAMLLATRKAKRKEAEKESDPFKKALLDAEQLAYKLTANSLYGQLGSATFKIRLQHLAASVTAYGRKQIMFAKAAIERFYGAAAARADCCAETVYGDTDSLFINFNVRDPVTGERLQGQAALEATMKLTEEAGKFVTRCLKPPHDFEYDKVFAPFIIFSKKRYVGNKYEESPTEYYQNSMGIATKRRDYAGIVKVVYGGAIRILLNERDVAAAARFVQEKVMDLAQGRTSFNQLTMSKSLRAEYKAATPPAHRMLADRIKKRDPGNAPASGDRIAFLYVLPAPGQEASKLQGERIETPAWIRDHGLKVDARFYIEHQLMNPITQLFSLVVEQLPGVKAPRNGWVGATALDRELAASEVLFGAALRECERASARAFAAAMFGGATVAPHDEGPAPVPRAGPATRSSTAAAQAQPLSAAAQPIPQALKQKTIQSMFMSQILMKEMDKVKKAKEKEKEAASQAAAAAPPAEPAKKAPRGKKAAATSAAAQASQKTVSVPL